MYDSSDPRASLNAAAPAAAKPATEFVPAEYGLFYKTAPQENTPLAKTWYTRGQNFMIAYSVTEPGASFERKNQTDEYAVLIHEPATNVEITTPGETKIIPGFSLIFVPPGDSKVTVTGGGPIIRLFTTQSADLAAKCANADSYKKAHPNIPPFKPWPNPPGGFRIRSYSLDVPDEPGRFGRIWRCTTLMVNCLPSQIGPRDVTKLSPHHHDDFEQGSLALKGDFMHHMRWPWTIDMNAWLPDDHTACASPSIVIIPPPSLHTSRWTSPGDNQLVDLFSPPRMDFSQRPGWVLNAGDYPMPP